jgi:anti-sigma B factor antagonist
MSAIEMFGPFEAELEGKALIVTPKRNLPEVAFEEIEAGAKEVLALADRAPVKNAVVDLCHADYCGSTALGFFIGLWRLVKARGGRLVLCNVSPHEHEVLRVTRLAPLWPVLPSREEALEAVRNGPAPASAGCA